MTVTFNRLKALSREDMHFLSWEHPMVTGVMDMILGGDFGNTGLCTLKLPPLKPGTLLLETVFVLHCPAPRHLQLHRFLPLPSQRLVIDANGKNLSAVLNAEHLDKLGQKLDKITAAKVVSHARPQITQMIDLSTQLANSPGSQDIVPAALAAMEKEQRRELDRLQSLARVNPNIRRQEIDHVREVTAALRAAMANAEWRLDALRVVITL
jgi:ATP-dependent helicase HepA